MARRQFLDNNLHHTKDGTGLLICISEDEHYVEILTDRGIDEYVDQSEWKEVVDELVGNIKIGNTHDGLLTCINNCGKLLKAHVPSTGPKNELPNRIVILN